MSRKVLASEKALGSGLLGSEYQNVQCVMIHDYASMSSRCIKGFLIG